MHRNVRITRGGGKTLTQGGGFQYLVWLMFRLPGGFISSHCFNIPYFGEGIPISTHIASGGWLIYLVYFLPIFWEGW